MEFISLQQKTIVRSRAKHKLINGCAGSHKTDTLIKCAVVDLQTNKRPILFLTLVGSVTFEIKSRLERALSIVIAKQGSSNHYLGHYDEIPVCISNYDAWVHLMLKDVEAAEELGSCYSEKTDLLLELTAKTPMPCFMKNGSTVGLLLIDEAQDLSATKMNILLNLKTVDIYIAGDYLQTLYSTASSESHAMNLFKKCDPAYFDLNICMRCPLAHVEFNNLLLSTVQRKYCIPAMQSSNENRIDKPVLFTHLATGDNTNSRQIAEQVTSMLEVLLEKDPSIVPSDIAVIMAKSKENGVYGQLEDTLKKLYAKRGFADCVLYMNTDGDGYHNTLDWNKAEGKTVMLSIHGDKGKGHKVVFFLGLTEGSIPRDIQVYTPSEIIPESLLNVGITRSTKYLFIGFAWGFPSRYLHREKDRLTSYTYCAWDSSTAIPEPYRSILAKEPCVSPYWGEATRYKKERVYSGLKSELRVKGDISKDFEQAKNLCMHKWNDGRSAPIQFGKAQVISMPLQEEHYLLLGILAEVLIERTVNRSGLFNLLHESSKKENVIYTEDEVFLCFMYDINNSVKPFEVYMEEHKKYLARYPELQRNICYAHLLRKKVVHSVFETPAFLKDLEEFLSDVPNHALRSSCIWNVCIFYNQLTQQMYRPAVNSFLGFFNEDISILHENINTYITKYLVGCTLQFEVPFKIHCTFGKDDCELLKKENHAIGISGRCDLYDVTNKRLYELKASNFDSCSQEWILQSIMYCLLLDVHKKSVTTMSVVNILKGCIWNWELPTLPTLEEVVEKKIAKKYVWHPIETAAMIREIKLLRSRF